MRVTAKIVCPFVLIASASITAAHHSTAAFDLRSITTIEGVVTRYEWVNPHVYLYVDARDANGKTVSWVVEAGSPAVMRARGWSKESFSAGESVVVKLNPTLDRSRQHGLVAGVQTNGRNLAGLSGPPGPESAAAATGASGLGGVWVPVVDPAIHQKLRLQPSVLPLTPKGAESLSSFREHSAMNPASNCIAPVAPVLMIVPEVKAIEVGRELIHIRSEGFGVDRVVHLNQASHDGAPASAQGHSIGSWEGRVLQVDTARFEENRVGNAIGLASGPRKHLIERFELSPDGKRLRYSFVLEDPEYLQEPVTGELQWAYRPDLRYTQVNCDPQNARRFSGELAE